MDSWADVIKEYLDKHPEITAITTTRLLRDGIGMLNREQNKASQSRVGIIMRRQLKWISRKSGSHRWFQRPGASNTSYPDDDANRGTSSAEPPRSPVSWPTDFSDASPQLS